MNIIPLTANGEAKLQTLLGLSVTLITRYNYAASCWSLDISSDGVAILNGVMLVPGADLLAAFPQIRSMIGSLVVFEQSPGDYLLPDSLGNTVVLVWYPVGEEVIL